jgi:GTP-binding nuclear protein Ran
MQTRSQTLKNNNSSSIQEKKIYSPSTLPEKKIVIYGDAGVGKSTYVNKLIGNIFDKRYLATLGVELYPLKFNGNNCTIWDTAGQERFGGLRENYAINADNGIIICSESKITQKSVINWYLNLKRVSTNIKIILLCNKSELNYELAPGLLLFLKLRNIKIMYISVKNDSTADLLKTLENFV